MARGVAIYYNSLEHVGGIESVILRHSHLFPAAGRPCVVLTRHKVERLRDSVGCPMATLDDACVEKQLQSVLTKYDCEWLIVHDPNASNLGQMCDVAHAIDCKVAVVIHFSFNAPIYCNEASRQYQNIENVARIVDAIACVSAYDTDFWRALGVNAFHVQNPFIKKNIDAVQSQANGKRLLWIGRCVKQKQPYYALKIVKAVAENIPDVRLTMVGVGEGAAGMRDCAQSLGVDDKVTIVDSTDDIGSFYNNADMLLMTSLFESFGLVITEAWAARLPVAMFELPYLDLTCDGNGFVSSPFGDVKGIADKIVKLLSNSDERQKIGNDGHEKLQQFNDDEVIKSWERLFCGEKTTTKIDGDILAREVVKAWKSHVAQNQWKIDFCDKMNRVTANRFPKIVRWGKRWIYRPMLNLKRKFRRK